MPRKLFQKGVPRPPNSGRRAGTPNKATQSIKSAFKEAFDKRGGVAALMAWAQKNPTEFYRLVTKLIPTEISGVDGAPIVMTEAERGTLRDKILEEEDSPRTKASSRTVQ